MTHPGTRSGFWSACCIILLFTVCAGLSVAASAFVQTELGRERMNLLQQDAGKISLLLHDRLNLYESLLRGAEGFFGGSKSVEADEWHAFSDALHVDQVHFPGLFAFTYVAWVPDGRLPGFIQALRDDAAAKHPGYSAFHVFPDGKRDVYAVTAYVEPDENTDELLGYDLLSDPARAEALLRARDTGEQAVSALLRMRDGQPGFLQLVPIYANGQPRATLQERRTAIQGFVVASIHSAELFGSIDEQRHQLGLPINFRMEDRTDPARPRLIYTTIQGDELHEQDDPDLLAMEVPLTVGGRRMVIRFSEDTDIMETPIGSHLPLIVLLAGLLLSVLLTLAVGWLLASHGRAVRREIDKMKSEFVSVASHQLRTPLTGIKWFTDLLLRGKAGKVSATQQDFLTQIAESNDRMIHLVEDLLNVSHIEMGQKFSIDKKPTDLIPVITSIIEELRPVAAKRMVTIIPAKAAPKKLLLGMDGEKIRQVLQNLLSNAVKYSREGGKVTVGCVLTKDGVTVSVRDTGIGIPRAQQKRMFEKFFRADNAQTEGTPGTGLGLYIAKAIAEGHGGKLWFESKENTGTAFFMRLPRG